MTDRDCGCVLQVRSLVSHFSPTLQAHLSLAFQHLQLQSEWEQEGGPQCQQTLPSEEASDPPKDLFQVLLRSQRQPSSWRYLLAEAMDQHCPTLTVLAACHQVMMWGWRTGNGPCRAP